MSLYTTTVFKWCPLNVRNPNRHQENSPIILGLGCSNYCFNPHIALLPFFSIRPLFCHFFTQLKGVVPYRSSTSSKNQWGCTRMWKITAMAPSGDKQQHVMGSIISLEKHLKLLLQAMLHRKDSYCKLKNVGS